MIEGFEAQRVELEKFLGYKDIQGSTVAEFEDLNGRVFVLNKESLEARKSNLDRDNNPSEQTTFALNGWPK